MTKKITRRSFLKLFGAGAVATGASTIVGCRQEGKTTKSLQEPPVGKMTYRVNHNTNDRVSILGYGMMRLPTKGQTLGDRQAGDEEVDQAMVNRQVDYALAHGVNYFDTAPVYTQGKSEYHTGVALHRHPRKNYFIATKMSNMRAYSREDSIGMFNNSLRELQTDYIDYYLLHSIGGTNDEFPEAMDLFRARFIDNGILDFLKQKRKQGVIRNLGFSYHGDVKVFDHALQMHDRGEAHWDFVQIELNYLDWHWANEINKRNTDAEYLYNELTKRKIPAVVMEPLLGGRLANMPNEIVDQLKQREPERSVASWAFRYAATMPNVLTLLSGMTYMEHLKDNLLSLCPLAPLTKEESIYLEEKIAKQIVDYKTIPCTDCKYCMPCPYGVDIPGVFAHYNKCLNESNVPHRTQDPAYARMRKVFLVGYDRSVPKLRQADHCIGCGACEPMCPQKIRIPREMHRIAEYVEELKQDKVTSLSDQTT
ncbi:MAG: aldo/keto reductase [Prevotella sp.]|nr:aldo/keto reductase [Prevotella sp.]